MLLSNLKVLLSERNLTAKKVCEDTGISRPTLGALINNKGTGIQFDTIDKLCSYLGVMPNQLLVYSPYNYEIRLDNNFRNLRELEEYINFLFEAYLSDETEISLPSRPDFIIDITFYKHKKEEVALCLSIDYDIDLDLNSFWEDNEEDSYEFTIKFSICSVDWDYYRFDDNYEEELHKCKLIWQLMPQLFKSKMKDDIISAIASEIDSFTINNKNIENVNINILSKCEIVPSEFPL